jgi:peptidyl-prolyl cis-trans isomerase B (cyclophilin B)
MFAKLARMVALMAVAAVVPQTPFAEEAPKTTSGKEKAEMAAEQNPVVIMKTSMGDIHIELLPGEAPATVANFLQYADDGFYDGTIFHRVIDGFMVQGGGFTTELERKETRPPVQNEADNGLANDRGTVAMARTSEPHSATSQFFINVKDNDFLNHRNKTPRGWGYTVFGRVVEGMETVDAIRRLPTGSGGPFRKDVPKPLVTIDRAVVVTPVTASEEAQ